MRFSIINLDKKYIRDWKLEYEMRDWKLENGDKRLEDGDERLEIN
ncbi:MAG: hypothetical protein ABIM99_02755 [Candidatus Dojkabacteria bacterium]